MSTTEKNLVENSRNEKHHDRDEYNQMDNASQADFIKNKTETNTDFSISAIDLENLMGKYKERGSDFADLKYFEEKSVSQLVQELKTDTENGLTSFEGREEAFGSNKVFVEPVPHFCSYVWEALKDLMVRILIVAAIVSIVLGCTFSEDPSKDWIDGVSIVIAVLVVVLVGSITDYQKEKKFHELNEVQAEGTKYKLIRNGQPEDHISDDLLVGDLVMINYGDIMPADVLLIDGNGIKMDESALTGESDAMKKERYEKCMELKKQGETKLPSPLILSGTNCVEGSGKGIVIAVGEHSQKGIIRRTVDNAQENSQTPLEAKLERIAQLIGYFGIGAGIVTLVALMIRFAVSFTDDELKEPAYEWLKQSVEGMDAQSSINVVKRYVELSYGIYKSNPDKYAEQYIADYQKASDVLNRIANDPTSKFAANAKEYKDNIDAFFAASGAADCSKLDELYAQTVKDNADNLEMLGKIMKLYNRVGCKESEVYFAAAEQSHMLQPTAESAAGCAAMSAKKGDYKAAIDYYDQAASMAEDAEDKANYLYNNAVYCYDNLKQFSRARDYARKSLEVKADQGRCYLLIGLMYAASKPYDDAVLNKTVYWVACDKFAKAKAVDPSVTEEANKLINSYSRYFPTTEEMFFNAAAGLVKGKSFTVGGWIGETTICR